MPGLLSFCKDERLCGRIRVDTLFSEGLTVSSFPVRLVYRAYPSDGTPHVSVLVTVSKKHFKRAVHRNRVKRQFREMYRSSRESLYSQIGPLGISLDLAVVFCDSSLWESVRLRERFDAAVGKMLRQLDLPSASGN